VVEKHFVQSESSGPLLKKRARIGGFVSYVSCSLKRDIFLRLGFQGPREEAFTTKGSTSSRHPVFIPPVFTQSGLRRMFPYSRMGRVKAFSVLTQSVRSVFILYKEWTAKTDKSPPLRALVPPFLLRVSAPTNEFPSQRQLSKTITTERIFGWQDATRSIADRGQEGKVTDAY